MKTIAAGSVLLAAAAALLPAAAFAQAPTAGAGGEAARPRSAPVEVVESGFPEELGSGIPTRQEGPGWLPYYVELRCLRDRPVEVELIGSLERQPDKGGPVAVFIARRKLEVAPGAPTRAWVYLRYEGDDFDSLRVRLQVSAEDGIQELPRKQIHLLPEPDDYSLPILVSGERIQQDIFPWGRTALPTGNINLGFRRIAPLKEKELPDHHLGYQGARLLILRNPDEKAMEPEQIEAIRRWVFLGGRVVLVPAGRGELFRGRILRGLLPGAAIGEPQAQPGFVGQDPWLKGESGDGRRRPPGRRSEPADAGERPVSFSGIGFTVMDPVRTEAIREVFALFHSGSEPQGTSERAVRLYHESSFGRGKVGVMTIDEKAADASGERLRHKLWSLILEEAGPTAALQLPGEPAIRSVMKTIEGGLTREVGVWSIAGLVVGYLLLIGPGVYLLLKRMGKLAAIVWVEPLVVLVYLGIIAATAYVTKGFLTRVQEVNVIYHSPGRPFVWKMGAMGLFSADDAVYRIAAPLSEDLEAPAGSGGGRGRRVVLPAKNRGPELLDFHLEQWATGTFTSWGLADAPPGFGVGVEGGGEGEEEAAVTITNRTGHRIIRGFLHRGQGKLIDAGEIPEGGRQELRPPFVPVELAEKGAGGEAGSLEGDKLLRGALKAVLEGSQDPTSSSGMGGKGPPAFIGLLQRGDEEFRVDRPSTLDRRLDLIVVFR